MPVSQVQKPSHGVTVVPQEHIPATDTEHDDCPDCAGVCCCASGQQDQKRIRGILAWRTHTCEGSAARCQGSIPWSVDSPVWKNIHFGLSFGLRVAVQENVLAKDVLVLETLPLIGVSRVTTESLGIQEAAQEATFQPVKSGVGITYVRCDARCWVMGDEELTFSMVSSLKTPRCSASLGGDGEGDAVHLQGFKLSCFCGHGTKVWPRIRRMLSHVRTNLRS